MLLPSPLLFTVPSKYTFPYRQLAFRWGKKWRTFIFCLCTKHVSLTYVSIHPHKTFLIWQNTVLRDAPWRYQRQVGPLFFAPPGFNRSLPRFERKASLPRSEGHLKAFRFSIVFNWYVYDQEGDKLWKGKTLVLLLRPPLTSLPESTSTKYPGAKSRITYIPATLTGNYPIKAAIPPPPFPS